MSPSTGGGCAEAPAVARTPRAGVGPPPRAPALAGSVPDRHPGLLRGGAAAGAGAGPPPARRSLRPRGAAGPRVTLPMGAGGGGQAPTGGGRAGGAARSQHPSMQTPRYSAHRWLSPGSREDADAPRHPSRSPGTRLDGFCSQPARKGFFSRQGEPGGSDPPSPPSPVGRCWCKRRRRTGRARSCCRARGPAPSCWRHCRRWDA